MADPSESSMIAEAAVILAFAVLLGALFWVVTR
jgi:hypothetical protein